MRLLVRSATRVENGGRSSGSADQHCCIIVCLEERERERREGEGRMEREGGRERMKYNCMGY